MGECFADGDKGLSGKQLVWGDLLLPLLSDTADAFREAEERMRAALPALSACGDRLDCRYAALVFSLCARKAGIMRELRARYLAGDRAYLAAVANEEIPALLSLYDELMRAHRALWERDMRRFGWEVIALRYGAVTGRLRDVQDELARYLSGQLTTLEELDAGPLPAARSDRRFHALVTAMMAF